MVDGDASHHVLINLPAPLLPSSPWRPAACSHWTLCVRPGRFSPQHTTGQVSCAMPFDFGCLIFGQEGGLGAENLEAIGYVGDF